MSRLVLIDGSSYFYRAFHALPPLSNSAGEPTGALFGVVNMLRSTLKEAPDYLAFVLDASGPTFRDELDPEYKANRPPMPDELRAQREPMVEIVEALGIPLLRVPGVEADDVIGTLAEAGAKAGLDVIISTSDKDFAQLVKPGITLVNTMSGSRTDRDRVIEKFGVPPERIIDFLALMGDKVDNVPGVDKCGPKTAAKWLAQYDDLDGVIAHANDVGGKIGENLRATLERLPLNRELVTIKTDVELDRGPEQLLRGERDHEKLRELFTRFEMNQALRELDGGAGGEAAKPAPTGAEPAAVANGADQVGEYRCITEQADFDALLEQLKNAALVCFDTETTSLDPLQAAVVGLSFATEPDKAAYIPLGHDYPGAPRQLDRDSVLAALKPVFEDEGIAKLAQHGKYDMHVLAQHGIAVNGYAFDSMLESFVYRAGLSRHDMDSLAERYLGYRTTKYEDVCGKGAKQIPFSAVDLETATRYAAEDADITLRLHRHLWPELQKEAGLQRVFSDIEMPLVPVLFRVEENGVQIDADELRRQSNDLGRRQHAAQQRAHEIAGQNFNLDSPKQLQGILFEQLGLPVIAKTPKGQPSTNEDVLEQLADQHELPRLILEYRGLAKLRSTYTEKLPEAINPRTGRVHTSYHQAGAATGRLSSSDPNLQNIPVRSADGRRIRRAFVAPEGRVIVACDYSQIELRIMAHLSGDDGLMKAFHEEQDIHRATASEVFDTPLDDVTSDQRRSAKAVNFGLIYGMGAFGLARQLGVDRGTAQDYIARYFARYPGVYEYMESTRAMAHEKGYVETLFGRRLYLDQINARNAAARAGAERAAINAPMQGTAADIIKRAMISVDGWISGVADRALMIMQVHDELVFEVDAAFADELTAEVSQRMQAAAELKVPLVVDSGRGANWEEAH